jgi:hypothetical protein
LGYQAVIAPFWSLHIDIPPLWLPVFLQHLNKGETISKSAYHANTAVYNVYAAPGAWACLHIYGNPYLRVNLKTN